MFTIEYKRKRNPPAWSRYIAYNSDELSSSTTSSEDPISRGHSRGPRSRPRTQAYAIRLRGGQLTSESPTTSSGAATPTMGGTVSTGTQSTPDPATGSSNVAAQTTAQTRSIETQTRRLKRFNKGTQTMDKRTGKKSKKTQTTLSATKTSLMIVPFFEPPPNEGKDFRDRTLSEILNWSDNDLEASHNYIQVLFPLPERSQFNFNAPLIDRATFDAFQSRPELRARLREAFVRMLRFYGFRLQKTKKRGLVVARLPGFEEIAARWLKLTDHNHLRISRILRCLRILGLEEEAAAFFAALDRVDDIYEETISGDSYNNWRRAADGPLSRPVGDGQTLGPDFLVELDEENAERYAEDAEGAEEGEEAWETEETGDDDDGDDDA